ASDYQANSWVEIRRPNSKGSASVWTPDNRVFYGRGETIPFSVLVRIEGAASVPVKVRLMGGDKTLAEAQVKALPGQPVGLALPANLTASLQAGRYVLTVSADGLTCVPQ